MSDKQRVEPLLQPSEQVASPPPPHEQNTARSAEAQEIAELLTHYLAAAKA